MPHNIPNHYVVDLDACLRCWRCFEACPTGAVDFKLEAREHFAILVADPDEKAVTQYSTWFEDIKFPFRQARSGEETIRILGEDDSIRMLLLDLSITDLDHERIVTRAWRSGRNSRSSSWADRTRARRPSAWWGWEPGITGSIP